MQFTFEELTLWNVATTDEPTWDPPLIELDLSSVQPNSSTTTIQAKTTLVLPPSPAATVKPSCNIAMAINQQLQGALEQLQQASPTDLTPVSLHSMPKREPPSVALGTLPPSEVTEGPPRPNEEDPAILAQMASPTQISPWLAMPEDIPSIVHISHSPSPLTMPKFPEAASTPIPHPRLPQGLIQLDCQMRCLTCRGNKCSPRAATHNQGHHGLPS